MSKHAKIHVNTWRVSLSVLLGLVMFLTCTGEGYANGSQEGGMLRFGSFVHEGLSAETEMQILQAYLDIYLERNPHSNNYIKERIHIARYLGSYNGCVAVEIRGPWYFPHVISPPVIIGGIAFHGNAIISAWKEGRIYRLQEAYGSGLLTSSDLRSIADITNPSWVGNSDY